IPNAASSRAQPPFRGIEELALSEAEGISRAGTTVFNGGGNDYEKEMVLDCAAGHCRDSAIYLRRRRSGNAPVELAAAATVRLADAWFLASVGTAGTVPDSVRWIGRPRWAGRRSRPPLPRALQEHVAGGAGKVSPARA